MPMTPRSGGGLKTKFDSASKSFNRAAADMDRDKWLDKWLAYFFGSDSLIKKLLDERKDLAGKMTTGPNEKARSAAQAETKKWASRYADWSAPVDKITAQISTYADKIDKLNADINNDVNRYAAMTSFWFEVAPKHVQLASDLPADVQAAVKKVSDKLAGYDDLKELLIVGPKRTDSSLYLAPAGQDAAKQREAVLLKWRDAATAQAEADVAFKIAPDDLASKMQRYDKLKDDGWIAEAKNFPEPPAQS